MLGKLSLETVAKGLPGAYIEEQDSYTHGIQVAIPPLGTTQVKLVLEELLQQRLGKVEFQMPLAPNEKIDQIVFDLTVEDLTGGPVEFYLDLASAIIDKGGIPDERLLELANITNTGSLETEQDEGMEGDTTVLRTRFHLDIPDAREYMLPKVLRGWYHPADIEESGLLATDGVCFEHFFLPSSAEPMPRNLAFLLDMAGTRYRLEEVTAVKTALSSFIGTLTPQDSFSIQIYGSEGTASLWGPLAATNETKEDARIFIDAIAEHSHRTDVDLQAAFLEALLRAQRDAAKSRNNAAMILVAMSAHAPTVGETDRAKIATNVYKLNQDGEVKIFTLGFPRRADIELLDAIALVNGGVSASILQGSVDYTSQISNFLENELGSILLADVQVQVSGNDGVAISGETQCVYPLLAYGSEVVVRGLIEVDDVTKARDLQASTTASTTSGMRDWTVNAVPDFYPSTGSLCFQSYAHERITQLLRLRDAAQFMESNVIAALVNLVDTTCDTKKLLPECLEAEALKLAIKGNVVVKGLTAMVTIDDQQCLSFEEDNEVCLDGSTPDGSAGDDASGSADDAAERTDAPQSAPGYVDGDRTYPPQSATSGGTTARLVVFHAVILWVGFELLMIYMI
jgi:hypothetical protein